MWRWRVEWQMSNIWAPIWQSEEHHTPGANVSLICTPFLVHVRVPTCYTCEALHLLFSLDPELQIVSAVSETLHHIPTRHPPVTPHTALLAAPPLHYTKSMPNINTKSSRNTAISENTFIYFIQIFIPKSFILKHMYGFMSAHTFMFYTCHLK